MRTVRVTLRARDGSGDLYYATLTTRTRTDAGLKRELPSVVMGMSDLVNVEEISGKEKA